MGCGVSKSGKQSKLDFIEKIINEIFRMIKMIFDIENGAISFKPINCFDKIKLILYPLVRKLYNPPENNVQIIDG